jgi:hypothetical protein
MKKTKLKKLLLLAAVLTFGVVWSLPALAQSSLPVQQIESTLGVQGTLENGVLDLSVPRADIGNLTGPSSAPWSVTFTPSFEINGDIFFQPLSNGQAFLNADIPLLESEVNPFITALIKNGLVWQAFHQHLPMDPTQIWFVHFRGTGDPVQLATAVRAALNTTGLASSLPLPAPSPPATPPLDPGKISSILGANQISVGDNGVVTAWVYRTDQVTIDGVAVNPQANISTNIQFMPVPSGLCADSSPNCAAVAPDFSMEAASIMPVANLMVQQGWFQGCLYNQETAESPQLYFDHMLKVGDAYVLAQEIRNGLNLTKASGLWQNATDLGNNWESLDWFGTFYTGNSPWIYSQTLGWLYPYGTSANSIWFWDPAMNAFVWTSQSAFPYFYRAADAAWLQYQNGTTNPPMFYNFNTRQMESD